MASQQVLFAETIAGMKKAFKRKAYESDSDSEIDSYGNRSHKLKKQGRFAHRGQLVPPSGPSAYKEYLDHDGAQRAILHRNPPLIDDEGFEIDSDDDEERIQDAENAAAELNPYANIRLERILAPLIASTDLPNHPTLSKPFTSKTLSELVKQSCNISQKENQSLWQVRHLLTALCGDFNWVPCEMMIGESDIDLYTAEVKSAQSLLSLSRVQTVAHEGVQSPEITNGDRSGQQNNDTQAQANPSTNTNKQSDNVADGADVLMVDADVVDRRGPKSEQEHEPNGSGKTVEGGGQSEEAERDAQSKAQPQKAEESIDLDPRGQGEVDSSETLVKEPNGDVPGTVQDANKVNGHGGGQIEARVKAPEDSLIHPMFLPPTGAKPDRDVSLPEQEAEDIRRLLALYVQKQEEICRGAQKLHRGLLKADQLRNNVLHWSKAEAHCGPNRDMSDGEDWYDKEEWGLAEDLKKGQDEEEDTVATGKKTRNRR